MRPLLSLALLAALATLAVVYAMSLQLGYHYAFIAANVGRLRDKSFRREQLALYASCGVRFSIVRLAAVFARQRLNELLARRRRASLEAGR